MWNAMVEGHNIDALISGQLLYLLSQGDITGEKCFTLGFPLQNKLLQEHFNP